MRLFKCTWIMLLIVNAMAIVSYASMPAPSAGDDGGKGRRVTEAKVPSDAVVLVQAFAKRQVQYGAGVIVHNSGYVATDLSIVKRAGAVVVYTMSGLMFDAWVIEGDVATGIALLKMPTKGLPTAKLSTQTTFKRNAKVYAVGFPQVHQLSAGRPLRPQLISGTIRATRMVASGGERAMAIETDIDISKSSPGAGLYDGAGQLIGIIVTHGRVLSGISFASPAGQLLKLMKRVGVSITPAPSQPSRRRIDTAVALGYLINGRVALEMRKMRRAKELFERALSGAPASAHYGLGMVYARQGQARRAISHLREATLLARNHGNAHELLGRVYMQAGNYPLAILHLKRALSIDPNYAGALGSIANAYHAQRRYKDALKFYQQALRILPDDLNLRTGLAQCYVALKRYKDAEREFLRILQRDPTLSGIHLNLAEIYEAMNRMDDAVTQYKLAVKYAPTDPMARLRLGMLYYQLGEIPNAINMLQEAIELNPTLAQARYILGLIYHAQGRLESALNELQRAAELEPRNTTYLSALGAVYTSLEDFDRAEEAYRTALRIDSTFVPARLGLGSLYYAQGKFDDAIAQLRWVLSLEPNNIDARYYLALCYEGKGWKSQALAEWQWVQRLALREPERKALLLSAQAAIQRLTQK